MFKLFASTIFTKNCHLYVIVIRLSLNVLGFTMMKNLI